MSVFKPLKDFTLLAFFICWVIGLLCFAICFSGIWSVFVPPHIYETPAVLDGPIPHTFGFLVFMLGWFFFSSWLSRSGEMTVIGVSMIAGFMMFSGYNFITQPLDRDGLLLHKETLTVVDFDQIEPIPFVLPSKLPEEDVMMRFSTLHYVGATDLQGTASSFLEADDYGIDITLNWALPEAAIVAFVKEQLNAKPKVALFSIEETLQVSTVMTEVSHDILVALQDDGLMVDDEDFLPAFTQQVVAKVCEDAQLYVPVMSSCVLDLEAEASISTLPETISEYTLVVPKTPLHTGDKPSP